MSKSLNRLPIEPLPTIRQWVKFLRAAAQLQLVKVQDSDLLTLASLLLLVGDASDKEAIGIYNSFKSLFFQRERQSRLRAALDLIPPDPEAIRRLARCIQFYVQTTGKSVGDGRCKLDQVVQVMLAIPSPEPYIKHLHGKGLTPLGSMFHPNTLERARKELRGAFGGTDEYWEKTLGQLNIASDD